MSLETDEVGEGNEVYKQFVEPQNHGALPKFIDILRDVVFPLSQVKKDPSETRSVSSRKFEIVERFLRNFRWTVGDNLYPVARLLLPERDGRLYHARESKLGDLIISIYKIAAGSADYNRIKKWKLTVENRFGRGEHGFAEICCELIKFRGANDVKGAVVTVPELNQFLDDFGSSSSSARQVELLKGMTSRMSLEEIRYLLKIMIRVKILRGMEKSFLKTWHPEAPRLLDLVNDLQRVFYQLYNPKIKLGLEDATVKVNYPFKPQLLLRTSMSYDQIVKSFQDNFYIEEKLDGERMQLHMIDGKFQFFSRKAVNYTSVYGDSYENGKLTTHLKGCFVSNVQSVILDGEMLVYDHEKDKILPFGSLKGIALATYDQLNKRPFFVAYDILLLNGHSLERASLQKRREALIRVLNPIPNVIEVIKYRKSTTEQEIEELLRSAIELNEEGVILKNPLASYSILERNKQWIKVKPEYLEEFGENVDLIVVGRIKQAKTSFICALRDDLLAPDPVPHFISFCLIANGFSQEDYLIIGQKLHGKWKSIKSQPPDPALLEFGSKLPDEWIDPRDSIVIEVKLRSIDIGAGGAGYKAETTLYNAYFQKLRDDKDWEDCLGLLEYREIKSYRSRKRKLDDNVEQEVLKKRHIRVSKRALLEEELSKTEPIEVKSDLFCDVHFYILSDYVSGPKRVSKKNVMRLVRENGGLVCLDFDTLNREQRKRVIILSDRISLGVQQLNNEGYDLIRPSWLFDCIEMERMIDFEPKHCLLVSDELNARAKTNVTNLAIVLFYQLGKSSICLWKR